MLSDKHQQVREEMRRYMAEPLRFKDLLWENDLPKELRPPRDPQENMIWRARLDLRIRNDYRFLEAVLPFVARSPYLMINAFGWTLDPRLSPPTIPMVQFDHQVDLVKNLSWSLLEADGVDRGDFFIKKSRDQGATWTVIETFEFFWQWQNDTLFLLGSFKEERVDKKRNSLFDMAERYIQCIPEYMAPLDYDRDKHRSFLRILNPNGSAMEGEATSNEFGRGDRKKGILFDEFAYWGEKQAGMDESAYEGCADVCNSRIILSTPKGLSNYYAHLHERFKAGVMRGMALWWWQDPRKNKGAHSLLNERRPDGTHLVDGPWRQAQIKSGRPKAWVAQEIDIEFTGTGAPVFDTIMMKLTELQQELAKRITEGTYAEAYTLDITSVEEGSNMDLGNRVTGMHRAELPDRGAMVDMMIDQRMYKGLPGVLFVKKPFISGWKDRYVVAVDQSENVQSNESDYTSILVVDRGEPGQPMEQVAWYRDKMDPADQAEVTHYLADTLYPGAFIAPEASMAGQPMIMYLREIYRATLGTRIYRSEVVGKRVTVVTEKLGVVVSGTSKRPMIDQCKQIIKDGRFLIHDLQFVGEALHYIRNPKGGYQAAFPWHDDTVITSAIAILAHLSGQLSPPRALFDKPKDLNPEQRFRKRKSSEEIETLQDDLMLL